MEQLCSHWTDFNKIWYLSIFRKPIEKIQGSSRSDKGTLREDQYIFLTISRPTRLRMKTVSDKRCRGNQNTYFLPQNFFFENRVVYEIMWKNTLQPEKPQMTIWLMCITCWITKAKNTHIEYVILTAFPLQQWLHKRASTLRYSTLPVLFRSLSLPILILPRFSFRLSTLAILILQSLNPSYILQVINVDDA